MVHEVSFTNGLILMFPPSNYRTDIMDGAGTEAHLIVAYGFSSRVCIIHYEILLPNIVKYVKVISKLHQNLFPRVQSFI